jgi:beta-glucosidase-like glycosyl hydrolase
MMSRLGRLLFPALRWSPETGYAHETAAIDAALSLGVGGFCLFGGEADAVRELTAELRSRSAHPLLIASDLERGAGQQFDGATQLPPLAAIGAVDDLEETRRAARLTAREALALGVNWVYAPDADIDLEPLNPIVGTRAFGSDPARVAMHVTAWIDGCASEGVLCCVKHFPGHGRTTVDSHAALPCVTTSREELENTDLRPFHAAIVAGVDAVMTAHVAYPALDASGAPATLSAPILTDLLRGRMKHRGLIVTDALIMEGVLEGGHGETAASIRALAAGCDVLLYVNDPRAVAAGVENAIGHALQADRVEDAIARVAAAADRAQSFRDAPVGTSGDAAWAMELGARSSLVVRGRPRARSSTTVITVDDDLGGPYPPPARDAFLEALRSAGFDARERDAAEAERGLLIAVYADIRAWKGRPGLSASAKGRIAELTAVEPEATVVLFGHPRMAEDMAGAHVLSMWGGEAVMQRAAARRLRELGWA